MPPQNYATLETLQSQLALARAQNKYLHRELATALKNAPLAPSEANTEEQIRLENEDLRQRYATLKHHYEDLQQRYECLLYTEREREKHYEEMWGEFFSRNFQTHKQRTFAPIDLAQILKQLLSIAHPDKWSQGQLAIDLAHELLVVINDARKEP
jgi:hypothetical protein